MDNNKTTFEKSINIACIVATIITSVIIICTILTTYQFRNFGQIFNSYYSIQLSGSITMLLWAIKFLLFYRGKERYLYSFISLVLSVGLLFFMNKL